MTIEIFPYQVEVCIDFNDSEYPFSIFITDELDNQIHINVKNLLVFLHAPGYNPEPFFRVDMITKEHPKYLIGYSMIIDNYESGYICVLNNDEGERILQALVKNVVIKTF